MQASYHTCVCQDHTSYGFRHQELHLLLNWHTAVGEGNQQDTLHFETLGGQLSVQSMPSEANSLPTIQITLPKSDSSMQLPNGLKLSKESLKVYPTGACHAVDFKCMWVCCLFCPVA